MADMNLLSKGLTTCEGCPMELIGRAAIETLGSKTITMTPPGCGAILTGGGDETGWGVPSIQTMLMSLPAYASGVSEALKIRGKHDVTVMGFAGDGGTFDIGFQALSGAIERGHKAIFICYNNEAYMNTGNQRSSATPKGAYTKTTPTGKKEQVKDIDMMLLHTPLAYQATASVSNIIDFKRKLAKAAQKDGPSFIHVLAPCQAGWKFPPRKMITIGRLAVDSGIWLLFEREDGKIKINFHPKDYALIKNYIFVQGRFRLVTDQDIEKMIERAKERYQLIEQLSMVKLSN
ncbi:thiamine pyrophosphate-dependent enzyme [Peptoniphilaceae bacterium SGI.137]